MKKSRFSDQQIAFALQRAETGTSVADVCEAGEATRCPKSRACFCDNIQPEILSLDEFRLVSLFLPRQLPRTQNGYAAGAAYQIGAVFHKARVVLDVDYDDSRDDGHDRADQDPETGVQACRSTTADRINCTIPYGSETGCS